MDAFGLAVYLQPLGWMWLYGRNPRIDPRLIYPAGAAAIIWLLWTGWSYAHYTNMLLISYVAMVMYVSWVFRWMPGIRGVCVAFLIVFLNSFYWEFPIHVADLLELDSFGVVALQASHLIAAPFLISSGMRLRYRWWYTSCWAWLIILGLTYVRLSGWMPMPWSLISIYVSRVVGLLTLLYILRYPEQGESKVYLKVRSLLNHGPR